MEAEGDTVWAAFKLKDGLDDLMGAFGGGPKNGAAKGKPYGSSVAPTDGDEMGGEPDLADFLREASRNSESQR